MWDSHIPHIMPSIFKVVLIIVSAPFVLSERFLFSHLCYTPIVFVKCSLVVTLRPFYVSKKLDRKYL